MKKGIRNNFEELTRAREPRFLWFIVLMAGVFFASCTTRLGEAKKLHEAGLYSEAAEAYEKIIATDPTNSAAKIGLAAARSEIWKKELISIRLMRMSGNAKGALERLEELLERVRAWDLSQFQSGDLVAAEEEVRNGRRALELLIREALNEKKPVVASHYWSKFDQVREAKHYGSYASTQFEDIQSEGKALCGRLQAMVSPTSFSFNNIYKAVCAHFSADTKAVELDFKQDYRFSRIDLSGKIELRNYDSTSEAQAKIVLADLDERLKNVGLFSSQSPYTIPVGVDGTFARDHEATKALMSHAYTVNVPYQEFEDYEVKEYEHVVENGMSKMVEKKVTKQRPITRYRMESRTHRYWGTNHSERLRMNLTLTAKLTSEISSGFAQDKNNNFITHNENLPEHGLTPKEAKFIVVSDWLQEQYGKASDKFIEKLALTLADKFCQSAKANDVSNEGAENYSRCAELNPKNPAASAWFTSTFGFAREQLLKVVGKSRT